MMSSGCPVGSWPKSWMLTMWSERTALAARASLKNRSTASGVRASAAGSTLIATRDPIDWWCAR
jgi:hypothetical protein